MYIKVLPLFFSADTPPTHPEGVEETENILAAGMCMYVCVHVCVYVCVCATNVLCGFQYQTLRFVYVNDLVNT